jgi:hypothetical protein
MSSTFAILFKPCVFLAIALSRMMIAKEKREKNEK